MDGDASVSMRSMRAEYFDQAAGLQWLSFGIRFRIQRPCGIRHGTTTRCLTISSPPIDTIPKHSGEFMEPAVTLTSAALCQSCKETVMRTLKASLAMAFLLALPACSGMTSSEKGTVAGAAVGGVAGSALTGGSALGTIGGAVGGGIIGHEVGESRDQRRR